MKKTTMFLLAIVLSLVGFYTYNYFHHRHYVELHWQNNRNVYGQEGNHTYNVYRTEDGYHVDTLKTRLHENTWNDYDAKHGRCYSYLVSASDKEGHESGFVNIANVCP